MIGAVTSGKGAVSKDIRRVVLPEWRAAFLH